MHCGQALAKEGKTIKVFVEDYVNQLLISNGKEALGLCAALYPSLVVHREILAGRMPPAQVRPAFSVLAFTKPCIYLCFQAVCHGLTYSTLGWRNIIWACMTAACLQTRDQTA